MYTIYYCDVTSQYGGGVGMVDLSARPASSSNVICVLSVFIISYGVATISRHPKT